MDISKEVTVIYHADCRDGFGAAYAAWKKFGDTASYIPLKAHVNEAPEGLQNKDIYILDFSFPKAVLETLIAHNKKVLVIDHHASAKDDVTAFPDNIFDLNHSGAVLAWHYFHPHTDVPTLLQYIEDVDLWRFALPESREFSTALGLYDMDFATWDTLCTNLQDTQNLTNFIAKGSLLAQFEDKLIAHMLTRKQRVRFEGQEVWAVNSCEYASALGNELAKLNQAQGKLPIGIVYYHTDNTVKISLRSIGETDVAAIAQKYGGGGHKNAAGIAVDSFQNLPFTFL